MQWLNPARDLQNGTAYQIELCTPPYFHSLYFQRDPPNRLAYLTKVNSFHYEHILNNPGAFEIVLPAETRRDSLIRNHWLIFSRRPQGARMCVDFVGIIRRIETVGDESGNVVARKIFGFGLNHILSNRIILDDTVTTLFRTGPGYRTGPADDVMRDYVRNNFKMSVGGNEVPYQDSVNNSDGPTVTINARFRNLLETLQDISNQADEKGTKVFFEVVYHPLSVTNGPDVRTAHFLVKVNRFGNDRRQSTGRGIVFGPGQYASPVLIEDASTEINTGFAVHSASNLSLSYQVHEDTARSKYSAWARREAIINVSDSNSTILLDAAKGLVHSGRIKNVFTGSLRSTPGRVYGKDWGYGDEVSVQFDGRQFDAMVRAVMVTVDENGQEKIQAPVEAEL
jgi:hypothetical protein